MSRRKTDPVDAAFDLWASLDTDQQQRFHDRVYGYQTANLPQTAADPKPRKPRKQKPQEVPAA
jgi:hypothetical protein